VLLNNLDYALLMRKNICVFCGSKSGENLEIIERAASLGRRIAQENYGIVFGGGRYGLMGAVAQAALEAGGHVTGIIPTGLSAREPVQQQLTELFVVDDIIARKRLMIDKSDIFVVLPGGLGTLDELFEVWTGIQIKAHEKKLVIANWYGYYDTLLKFMKEIDAQGFLNGDHLNAVAVTQDLDDLMAIIQQSLKP